jgi:hypothetical protein
MSEQKVHVIVTQDHINRGESCSSERCPISLALSAKGFSAQTDAQLISIGDDEYGTPAIAQRFIESFDADLPVGPIEFDLYRGAVLKDDRRFFTTMGTYGVSNSIGYEIEINGSGDAGRALYTNDDGTFLISLWRPIEYKSVSEDLNEPQEAHIIDCFGIDIPLSEVISVMKVPNDLTQLSDEELKALFQSHEITDDEAKRVLKEINRRVDTTIVDPESYH